MKSRKIITVFVLLILSISIVGCSSSKTEEYSNQKVETIEGEKETTQAVITSITKVTSSQGELSDDETQKNVETENTAETEDVVDTGDVVENENDVETGEVAEVENNVQNESDVETENDVEFESDVETGSNVEGENSVEEFTTDYGIKELPSSITSTLEYWRAIYPNMSIGVGLYSLDGTSGYEYNAYTPINSACTIKAAYALFVLKEAEKRGIDIWSTYLTYEERHSDPDGSGDINLYGYYGNQYSIAELIRLLLQVSDNVAYNMLLDEFTLNDFYMYNSTIGGENDWSKWGAASVNQRKNEWIEIWRYINSGSLYSQVLREDLTGTQYAYFLQGMQNWHSYMQKSGWTENSPYYPATGEAAIIDDSYLLIVLTQDYTCDFGHIDVLQSIGGAVESYWYANNGYIF